MEALLHHLPFLAMLAIGPSLMAPGVNLQHAGTTIVSARIDGPGLWAALGTADPVIGNHAISTLVDHPHQAILLLKSQVGTLPCELIANRVQKLVGELNSPRYTARHIAFRKLQSLGPTGRPALEQMRKQPLPPETRRRLELLLAENEVTDLLVPEGELLSVLRSIHVLEQIGTLEAQHMLTILLGHKNARIRHAARAALMRLSDTKGARS
jgi:hypothetical protein